MSSTAADSSSEDVFAQYSMTICGLLSLVSTALLIIYYIFFPRSRSYGFRLVLSLFIYDFIWNLNIILPLIYLLFDPAAQINSILCTIQGVVAVFATLASFFSTAAISWSMYTAIIRRKPIKTKNPLKYFAAFTFLLPLVASIIPVIVDRYDHLDPLKNVMCFLVLRDNTEHSTDYLGMLLRIFLVYLPFIIVLVFDMTIVIRISIYFHKYSISSNDKKDIQHLMLYPMVLFISWIWIILARVFQVNVGWLNKIDLTLSTLNGFLNALVYGYISLYPFKFLKRKESTIIIPPSAHIQSYTDDQYDHSSSGKSLREPVCQYSAGTADYSLAFNGNPSQNNYFTKGESY